MRAAARYPSAPDPACPRARRHMRAPTVPHRRGIVLPTRAHRGPVGPARAANRSGHWFEIFDAARVRMHMTFRRGPPPRVTAHLRTGGRAQRRGIVPPPCARRGPAGAARPWPGGADVRYAAFPARGGANAYLPGWVQARSCATKRHIYMRIHRSFRLGGAGASASKIARGRRRCRCTPRLFPAWRRNSPSTRISRCP